MTPVRRASARWTLAAAAVVLAGFVVLIALSPHYLVYDERYYLESAYFLAEHFDFGKLMATPLDLVAGPLYAYLHVALSPLTELRPPAIRFVNLGCLAVTLLACAAVIRRLGYRAPLARAAMVLAVPMIGPTSGLALTELPALALVSLSVLAVTEAVLARSPGHSWLLWSLAGIAAGLALLGRQTYLPGLVAFPVVGWAVRGHFPRSLLATALALAVLAPLVIVWRGLTPPWGVRLNEISPEHGVLAFVYLATAALLMAPRFFLSAFATAHRRWITAIVVIVVAATVVGLGFHFPVGGQVVGKLPAALQRPAVLALDGAMLAAFALVLTAAAFNLWECREDRPFLLLAGLTVLLNGTAAGIGHQFSSRYVLTAFPFALLALQPWVRPGSWAAARLLVGAALGFASLVGYYHAVHPDPYLRLAAPPEIVARMPLDQHVNTGP